MQAFEVSTALDRLTDVYPPADYLLGAAKVGDRDVRYAMSWLWLSEGIPFAFKARPGLYEALRIWLARRLVVQAKEITIVGSGRQGFSLSADQNVVVVKSNPNIRFHTGTVGITGEVQTFTHPELH